MNTVQVRAKSGKLIYIPVMDEAFEQAVYESSIGLCIMCGAEAYGVEPDARRYECESCQEHRVYGLEELVMMGLVKA